ncbi:hypothetical protein TSUD_103310 [Trifolium subterraneum]|uniref:Uncharacterized protein n=1 Tax=Trifolium subterraneum TaxID=3900 RepID=A0A2Z6MRM4_TRISU|nr:hypothetical protein TSUD_103310 [Trifolium subterraneum]
MAKMGFPSKWRGWISECVSSATASVLVNGSPTNEFHFQRALRQGDPLSPFLFLLAVESLNVMMNAAINTSVYSGYPMNFHKSMLVGINVAESWLVDASLVLNCKIGQAPFVYLGLPIGGNPRRLSFWQSVVERIRKREYGGLGVKRIREFNLALLGKWWWRLLVDQRGLWFKVLVARYGFDGGRVQSGGRLASQWWRDLLFVKEGGGLGVGNWVDEMVVKAFGNGESTLFWFDSWLDGGPLCNRFRRIFYLYVDKNVSVAEMYMLGWGVEGEEWRWRRRLFAWEEDQVRECSAILANFVLLDNASDKWIWRSNIKEGFTV